MVSEPARRAAPHPHGERNARIKTLGDQTINPANGETLQSFPDITDAALEAVLANAAQAYEAWRHKSYAARADVIGKAAALLHAQAESFAQTMTLEKGQRISEARGAVEFSARILTYYARNAERFLAPVTLHPMHGQALMASSPIGVIFARDFYSGFLLGIFAVEPWNFPYYQLARLAGPQPMRRYTNLFISHGQTGRVIADARIKAVALTGSVDARRIIAAGAGKAVKISSMELGGVGADV